jgi:hypothetical protein
MTQHSMKKGIKLFGQASDVLQYLMFLKKKRNWRL